MNREHEVDVFVEEKNSGLSMASQSIVINHLFDFIKTEYSCQIEPKIAEDICKAAVELFASLKKKDSTIGGIVSYENIIGSNKKLLLIKCIVFIFGKDNLYDKVSRKGIIYQKLRYAKRKRKEGDKSGAKQRKMSSGNMSICDEVDDESFGEKAANLIEFVQNCTLPRDTTKIKRMFEETIGVRQTMMLKLDTYKPLFDLLFLSPDLVNSVYSQKLELVIYLFLLIILFRLRLISICDFRPPTAKHCHWLGQRSRKISKFYWTQHLMTSISSHTKSFLTSVVWSIY